MEVKDLARERVFAEIIAERNAMVLELNDKVLKGMERIAALEKENAELKKTPEPEKE